MALTRGEEMKKLLLSAACAAAFGATPALASSWDISGSFGVVSDYVFRGISQTQGDAALQAGATLTHDSGVYFTVWGSNVDFAGDNDTDFEVDFTLGYGGSIDAATTFNVNVTYYTYPGQPDFVDYNYFEIGAGVTHDVGNGFSVGANFAWSPKNFDDTGNEIWLALNGTYEMTEWLSVSANLGYQSLDKDHYFPEDYFYYDVGATVTYGILSLDMRYVATSDSVGKDKFVGSAILNF